MEGIRCDDDNIDVLEVDEQSSIASGDFFGEV
jgi:hypothetical protein